MPSFLERLAGRNLFGVRPGLDAMHALLGALGHPEAGIAAIHIAGTNGKGSTAAFLDAILHAAGIPCGRYTSPHLVWFNERICLNGRPVADDLLQAASDEVEAAEKKLPAGTPPATFFEMATAIAFCVFRNTGTRLVILETGLGGRLDATNVVTPLLSVITRVGLDHTAVLGGTLEAVATEKAGIIKPGRPVVIADMPDVAREVLLARARACNAPVHDARNAAFSRATSDFSGLTFDVETPSRSLARATTKLAGLYQLENIATALTALEALEPLLGIELPAAAIRRGLGDAVWPGRFQLISETPPTILDGGHNPDGARALKTALKAMRFKGPAALVAGFCQDKDIDAFLRILAPSIDRAWAVPIRSARAEDPARVAGLMRCAGIHDTAMAGLSDALAQARQWATEHNGCILICGSLFLAGEVLQLENLLPWQGSRPATDVSERFTPPRGT